MHSIYLLGNTPLQTTLLLSLFTLLLYLLSLFLYNLLFHPLASYPGPLLAKLTDLYSTYHALLGDRHIDFHRLHTKYGPVVRYGPNSLSFNTSTALKEIYGHKANVQKAKFYEAFWASRNAQSTHSSIDKSVHARKRRVLSHAFSDAAIKSMEKHILSHIRQFCENLSSSGAVNISDQSNYLTFDIMGDLCFGKPFSMLTVPTNRFAINLITSAARRHLICGTYPLLHKYHLDKFLFPHIAAGRAKYMSYSKSQAAERMSEDVDVERKDFFYYLLKAKDPETGQGFTVPELWGESNLLIIAGSDTTSTALAATIFYLVHNPSCLAHLTTLIRSTFHSLETITLSPALSNLTYLRACIDESMRLSPSVGGILPREILPGGLTLTNPPIHLPPGTIVGVPHYAIHHNEAYYPDPFAFKPSRWISLKEVELAQSAFCPFSIGPRGCIGKGMAYAELTLTIARVLWMYNIRLPPDQKVKEGEKVEFQLKDSFTSMKQDLFIECRRREDI